MSPVLLVLLQARTSVFLVHFPCPWSSCSFFSPFLAFFRLFSPFSFQLIFAFSTSLLFALLSCFSLFFLNRGTPRVQGVQIKTALASEPIDFEEELDMNGVSAGDYCTTPSIRDK